MFFFTGDTDSVLWDIWPGRVAHEDPNLMREAFEFSEKASTELSSLFPSPNKLEFEKCMSPFMLFDKKRYSGLLYSADLGPERPKKVENKGIQVVRRDTVEYVRDTMTEIIHAVLYDHSILKAATIARTSTENLFENRVDISKLIMSKKVASSYKTQATWRDGTKSQVVITPHGEWTCEDKGTRGESKVVPGKPWELTCESEPRGTATLTHPHVHVMHLIDQRCPGSGPCIGERVKYVFVENRRAKLQIERARDPEWVAENKTEKLDSLYYFEHCLRKPIESIFCIVYDDPYKVLFADLHRRALNVYGKQTSIKSFFI